MRDAATICLAPVTDLKVVSESRATSVSILLFLGLSVLDLGPMYVTDVRRQTDVRRLTRIID